MSGTNNPNTQNAHMDDQADEAAIILEVAPPVTPTFAEIFNKRKGSRCVHEAPGSLHQPRYMQ